MTLAVLLPLVFVVLSTLSDIPYDRISSTYGERICVLAWSVDLVFKRLRELCECERDRMYVYVRLFVTYCRADGLTRSKDIFRECH